MVTETGDRIQISHAFIKKRFGLAFAASFVATCAAWSIYSSLSVLKTGNPLETKMLLPAGIVIFCATFVFSLIFYNPRIDIAIDSETSAVEIIRGKLSGAAAERFYFHQIRKFKSYTDKSKRSSRYFLALILTNGRHMRLSIPIAKNKLSASKLIRKFNVIIKDNREAEKKRILEEKELSKSTEKSS